MMKIKSIIAILISIVIISISFAVVSLAEDVKHDVSITYNLYGLYGLITSDSDTTITFELPETDYITAICSDFTDYKVKVEGFVSEAVDGVHTVKFAEAGHDFIDSENPTTLPINAYSQLTVSITGKTTRPYVFNSNKIVLNNATIYWEDEAVYTYENIQPSNIYVSGTCGDNVAWSLDLDTGVLTISGTGEMENYSSTAAPWWGVARSYINSVVIEDGVTSIGKLAFSGCSSLTSVTIPDSVTSIGDDAFSHCYGLTSITIPDSVTSIGDWAFYCSKLTSVTIGNSVTSIGYSAFSNCTSLTSITIGNGVTSIGDSAFYNCSSLTSVTIPDSVTSIGYSAFSNCTSLTSITIGNGVTSIGNSAFYNCSSLTSVTIPDSVTNIGSSAFSGCSGLEQLYILSNSTKISPDINYDSATSTLTGSSSLPSSTVIYSWPISAAKDYSDTYGHAFVELDESYEQVRDSGPCGDNATYTLTRSGVLTISGVGGITIAPWASNAAYISDIIIEDGIRSIGSYAFSGCSNVKGISISDTVTNIGEFAFNNCSSLTNIDIPEKVANIGTQAFGNCISLERIDVEDSNKYYADIDGVLFNKDITTLIKYPSARSATEYTIPNTVTNISSGAPSFSSCNNLVTVNVPASVSGGMSFSGCSSLRNINIPNTVTSVSFSHCTSLENVTIPDSVVGMSFTGCSSLKEIQHSGSAKIAVDTLGGCSSLEKIIILNSTIAITDSYGVIPELATIYAYSGSTAQAYAEKYGYTFVALENLETAGDLNSDNLINDDDVTYLLYHTFFPDTYPVTQDVDFNNDGVVDDDDVTYLLYHTFFPDVYPID